jgi:hypothetical protein
MEEKKKKKKKKKDRNVAEMETPRKANAKPGLTSHLDFHAHEEMISPFATHLHDDFAR